MQESNENTSTNTNKDTNTNTNTKTHTNMKNTQTFGINIVETKTSGDMGMLLHLKIVPLVAGCLVV